MLKMRLQRVGRKHDNAFRVVLTESENSSKSGRFKEVLGSYDPRKTVDLLKVDRIKYWLEKGALPTGTVHNLLVTHKILDAKKVNVLPKKTVAKKEEPTPEPVEVKTEVTPEAPAVSPSQEVTADQAVVESTEAAA